MTHHKRRRPKQRRAGCLLCKPQKSPTMKKAERRRTRRDALSHELRATQEHGGQPKPKRLGQAIACRHG